MGFYESSKVARKVSNSVIYGNWQGFILKGRKIYFFRKIM